MISFSVLISSDLLKSNKNKLTDSIKKKASSNIRKLYNQATKINSLLNIEEVLCIKDTFPNLPVNKVADIMNIANKNISVKKPKINIMTKELSRKQVIILITETNTKTLINLAY